MLKGIFCLSDYCRDFWPIKTQPEVSAWFFLAGLILLLRQEGNFFRLIQVLKEKHFGPSRVPLKEKSLQECREPRGIIPKES